MITAILKIKTTIEQVAQEALEVFGRGGNPTAEQIEGFLGYVNTPVSGDGYVRVLIGKEFGQALEYIHENYGSEHADLVRVEWLGQDRVVTGQDEDGNDIIEEQLFLTGYTVAQSLEDGSFIPEQPVCLGRMC
jgi:hypothetical protein